jgi:hypothetical protein
MNRLTIRQRVTASISELKAMTYTQLKASATANEMEHNAAAVHGASGCSGFD